MKKTFLFSISSESKLVKTPCTVLYFGVPGLIRPVGVILEEECVADAPATVKGSHENTMFTILSPIVCKVASLCSAEFVRELEQKSPLQYCDFLSLASNTTDTHIFVLTQHFLPNDA